MRQPWSPRALLLALSLLGPVWPAHAEQEAEHTMILATVAPPDSPWSALLTMFKKNVEERATDRSNPAAPRPRLKVKLKLGGTLGDENESVTKCQRGQIQAVGASTGALASSVPELHLVELPFLFRDTAEADLAIDKVLTPAYEPLFRKRGLVLGFWSENGFRHFGTRDKPVKSIADLKGKKMRSQESPVHLSMYKHLGASAVPIPTTEVPQALATGNVDGFDQSALYAIATAWTKSIKFFTVSEHIYQPAAIVYNQEWFNKLPADLQGIIMEEGRALQPRGRDAVRKIFPDLLQILKTEGVTVHVMTPEERAPFEKVAEKVWADFRDDQGKEASALLDRVQAALKEKRKAKSGS